MYLVALKGLIKEIGVGLTKGDEAHATFDYQSGFKQLRLFTMLRTM